MYTFLHAPALDSRTSVSVTLSAWHSVYLPVWLTFCHPVNILNKICFDITTLQSLSVFLSVCHSIFLASTGLSFYFSDILFTFWTTFVLITKLKSLLVFLSVCLSFYLSGMLLIFWTTFVLMTIKLKSLYLFLSVFLSVCPSVFLYVCLSF